MFTVDTLKEVIRLAEERKAQCSGFEVVSDENPFSDAKPRAANPDHPAGESLLALRLRTKSTKATS